MGESGKSSQRRGTFRDLFQEELEAIGQIRKRQAALDAAAATARPDSPDAAGGEAHESRPLTRFQKRQLESLDLTLAQFVRPVSETAADSAEDRAAAHSHADRYERCSVNEGDQPGHQEPFVDFVADDLVGLALSGGGIRSATFNLGLLQGLHDLKLLPLFDYLSTVSGGGYIGGWWSAWRHRIAKSDSDWFPESHAGREADEVRHIREFSNFLIPHLGFFRADMWTGIVAVISGIVPTLSAAIMLMFASLVLWMLAVFLYTWPGVGAVLFAIATGLLVVLCERSFRRRVAVVTDAASAGTASARRYAGCAIVFSLLIVACLPPHREFLAQLGQASRIVPPEHVWKAFVSDMAFPVAGLSDSRLLVLQPGIQTKSILFMPGLAWFVTAIALMLIRYRASWSGDPNANRAEVSASSRVIGRLLAVALMWVSAAMVWVAAGWLWSESRPALQLATGGMAALGVELFRRTKKWLSASGSRSQTGKILDVIRPMIPQLLAYGVLAIVLVLLAAPVSWVLNQPIGWMWSSLALCGVFLLVIARWLSPEGVGLHAFYRGRLARAYLGASNPRLHGTGSLRTGHSLPASVNRQTITHHQDDLPFASLATDERGPLHLICCAANDLAGSPLQNLGRGARSAVLSARGVAVGNQWSENRDLTLGTAQTASAAAFNSNMGSVSTRLGPAVSLLATALNLRLGLWLRHPASELSHPPKWRGWRFFKEMFGQTYTELIPSERSGQRITRWQLSSQDMHLSDGGHFENLALYELVRRHCRYIILSDCGADPEMAFDDLGNALRRIRHDFDVEIEIDINPLKPQADGQSQQHMAVGTIHYNRTNDKGILLYFKPNLTGDEPDDIRQYHTRNDRFPNESTGDQFYDESQWESYRRLGEHAARSSLRFVEHLDGEDWSVPSIFSRAYWYFAPTPKDLTQTVLRQSDRFRKFLDRLERRSGEALTAEALPQCGPVGDGAAEDTQADIRAEDAAAFESPPQGDVTAPTSNALMVMMEMAQLMEDVYFACSLESHWNHPLNYGWMNLFRHWGQSQMFRTWWPLLQSFYGREFREFVNQELHLADRTPACLPPDERAHLVRFAGTAPADGLAYDEWKKRRGRDWPADQFDAVYVLNYPLSVLNPQAGQSPKTPHVQLAFLGMHVGISPDHGPAAWWEPANVYVPVALWNTGLAETLIRGSIDRLSHNRDGLRVTPERCVVELADTQRSDRVQRLQYSDQGSRKAHADLIRFYAMLDFQLVRRHGQEYLVRELT